MSLETLSYAAGLVPEIAGDIVAVDQAVRLAGNWTYGPFELIDRLGADWLAAALDEAGRPVPTLLRTAAGRTFYRVEDGRLQYLTLTAPADVARPDGVLYLSDIKRAPSQSRRTVRRRCGTSATACCAWSSPAR